MTTVIPHSLAQSFSDARVSGLKAAMDPPLPREVPEKFKDNEALERAWLEAYDSLCVNQGIVGRFTKGEPKEEPVKAVRVRKRPEPKPVTLKAAAQALIPEYV